MCCSGRRYLYGRRAHMTDDQRFASCRTDVLVYESDVLSEDVTLLGPFTASLNVSTSGTDSDFIIKLIDVYSGDFPNPEPNPRGLEMGGASTYISSSSSSSWPVLCPVLSNL